VTVTPGPRLPAVPGVQVEHHHVALPDGTRLHVAEAGAGPPLVLVHGWPQHWWAWRRVLPDLAAEHRVLCPDLRGLGWGDAPPGAYAKEDWATDVLALLDALGLERVDLVGHDWGGLVALLVALRAPERLRSVAALSIFHPWTRTRPSPRTLLTLAYQPPLATPVVGERLLRHAPHVVRTLIRRGSHRSARWTDEELDTYARVLQEPARARASSALYRTFLLREAVPFATGRYAAARLNVPALMLTGAADAVVGPPVLDGFEAHADRGRTAVVERCGHFPPEERHGDLLAALHEHLGAA
jgi:pimeloyl-ACP methyl ester carboxylesterase